MTDFRKIKPERRVSVPQYKSYRDYKPLLREDFHHRCGYCGDHDYFRDTFYEVDHFVPRDKLVNILPNDYSNLVYSCRSCNNSKRAKWPTNNENIPNNGKEGFIDPCEDSYSEQFERLDDGAIVPISDLGQWMWSALNMGNPRHRIIWSLEQLKSKLQQIEDLEIDSPEELKRIQKINKLYHSLEDVLRGKPNFE